MSALAVEIQRVEKHFGSTRALGGCNLRANTGEVHAIVGGNGSGKSTLAKVISGVLIPDGGQVSILGKTPTSPLEAKKIGIANVFQEVLVADSCSVLDNLYLGSDYLFSSKLSLAEKEDNASKLMHELLGFDINLHENVGNLPLSVKQWITIARALLSDPKILILDESSAALDFDSTERLFRKIRKMRDEGKVIFIVTHRIAELIRISDKATVLRDGVDVGCLEKQEITEQRFLEMISGEDKKRLVASKVSEQISGKPVLRLANCKVWPISPPVNFDLLPGEIVGVTGLDGQGHVDFVRGISCVQPFSTGSVTVINSEGDQTIRTLHDARQSKVIYVTGDRKKEGIFPNLSIHENLSMPIYKEYRAGGIISFTNRSKLDPVFDWETNKLSVKMGNSEDLITSLSGGNQQKVLIARAFAEKPDILVLNDPARGIDIGAKLDLYRNLANFAASGKSVIFLSSEVEEFLDLCNRVIVFRNGIITSEFEPPFTSNELLNAMFGRRKGAASALPQPHGHKESNSHHTYDERTGRVIHFPSSNMKESIMPSGFTFRSESFDDGDIIPDDYVEDANISPPLSWSNPPEKTKSFAITVTDPDLPSEFNFPRSFAHWMICDLPADIRSLPRGASPNGDLPEGAKEMRSDFVTFNIPGYDRGYGGPWPPDREHRYIFTIYALMTDKLNVDLDGDLEEFSRAVLPVTIASASFTGRYGPAKNSLPSNL